VVFDATMCRTCRVCELACSIAHEGEARPSLARIAILFDEFAVADPISAILCQQCQDAPCVTACPEGAMRYAASGAVVVETTLCTGCMRCRRACPWHVPKLHRERKVAIKCDLCEGIEGGPRCVAICPLSGKALRYAQGEVAP
jgi:Fe-S-cluster-containing hydrogenase component 2